MVVDKYTYVKNTFGKYVKCVNLREILLTANQSKSTLEYIGEYTLQCTVTCILSELCQITDMGQCKICDRNRI